MHYTIAVGTVNKQSSDHIGLLAFGIFNAAISSERIPRDRFSWHDEERAWLLDGTGDEDGDGEVVDHGTELCFVIEE